MPPPLARVKVNPRYAEKNWDANDAGQYFEQRLSWNDPLIHIAAATANYDMTTFPSSGFIVGAGFRCTQNWTGGALSNVTFSAGTTASPAAYIAATTVFSGAPKIQAGVSLLPFSTPLNAATPLANATIRLQFVATGGNLNLLTQGYVDVYLWLQFFKFRLT